ncbi:xanthine dehydrogenase-like [Babylonia areolata]|uniref:xanthine dehydrogenase-like n=1 Tax=Babylonia areolata TaxID=304850 RepID=UPI003FD43F12
MAEPKVGIERDKVVCCPVCGTSHVPLDRELKNGVYATSCEQCGFFFKFRAKRAIGSSVTFYINGSQCTVSNEYDPATSLNEYLRMSGISRGTKQMCIEGGCGVCLVTARLYDPLKRAYVVCTVNSCLVQLYMCDGWEITTIEGLGNTRTGLHPVQDRLAKYNGSQCGFCSPAQVMNMYGLLKKTPAPTMQEVEDNFDATICRCTGYRSILDAMKSFCVDAPPSFSGGMIDIEDLDSKICRKTGESCSGQCRTKDGAQSHCTAEGTQDSAAKPVPLHIVSARAQWFKPTNTSDLYDLLNKYRDENYRLVFGNTGFGVYKDIGPWNYDVLIDVRGVDLFYLVKMGEAIDLGANISLASLLELFEENAANPHLPYFAAFARHMKQVASNSVRNLACWAGSLMLKHHHPDFVSDVFTLFETVGAELLIGNVNGSEQMYSLSQFLELDMKGKVIVGCVLPKYTDRVTHVNTFRVSQRLQNCHGYVTAGFNFKINASSNYTVLTTPTIVYQGINSTVNRATKTENFLQGKQLGNQDVLKGALAVLGEELNPDASPVLASPAYRKTLAQALFYKFVLQVCPSVVNPRYLSGAFSLERPVSSGKQSFGTQRAEWPLTEPMTKRDATYQTSGEIRYLDDESLIQKEVYAAFVISDVANADILHIDPSAALGMSGVYKFISAADFPTGGDNNFMPPAVYTTKEEIFSSGKILYAGQPVGLIVAADALTAESAAAMVKVTYKNVKAPLLDMRTAIQQKSFFPDAVPDPLVVGNPDGAISKSARRITGSIECGSQTHFQLESQTARCVPGDDGGMEVQATTQWIDGTAEIVARVLNIPENSVTVEVKRLGGAFGSKISRNFMVSGACALAAHVMQRPVRLRMDFHTNMKTVGKRFPFLADYEAGFTEEGKLNGVKVTFYGDCGSSPNDSSIGIMYSWLDNAYYCQNWKFTPYAVKTNKPSNTYCRSPGSVPAQFIMESIMEHVAKTLKKDPTDVRVLNLYQKGQTTANGMKLDYCTIDTIVEQVKQSSDFSNRQQQVALFNKANRWKKRGLSLVPTRFGIIWSSAHYNVLVAIYHSDGTIAVEHGGIEVGQGINQKACQVCAYELGVPVSLVRVKKGSSIGNANSITTGGSITSELNALGVQKCCEALKSRMKPVREKMGGNPSWQQLVTECYNQGVDLSARFYTNPKDKYDCHYNVYAATVTEAEVDVLTGQSQLNRVDMLYDCGDSMNPEIDIGQVEGGFVMGLGYHLTEKVKVDPSSGVILTDGTWEYKPPMPKDLPVDFRISLLKNAPNPVGVLRSKTAGEPPLVMASSALFAIKHAAEAARQELELDSFFPLNSPALVEDVQTSCLVQPSQFVFGNSQ